jgi:uncharacterized protein (UPF0276 family)
MSVPVEFEFELGLGIGWRREIAGFVSQLARGGDDGDRLGFVEVVAESVDPSDPPRELDDLRELGLAVVPHGISLSLGGSERPERRRLERLGAVAKRLGSPLVSEHIAFVRAGGVEAGHLLPVPRTHAALEILVSNVREAQAQLPVLLALEHVAALVEWPDAELSESEFLRRVLEETGAPMLVDVANLYANSRNHGFDPLAWLDEVPLDRVAYVHMGGGIERDGLYHDTHGHPVVAGVLELLEELCARTDPPGVLLERDENFPPRAELAAELGAIAATTRVGADRRRAVHARSA